MTKNAAGATVALVCITTLFFAWGFVTSTIDPLVASVRGVFRLSFAEAMLTQFAWFIAYGLVSIPAAALLGRLGYANAIVSALVVMVLGALMVPAATMLDAYWGVLAALFVIASGVTLLQVAANPLAASLGRPERAHFRLMLAQSFNSLGTVVGPFVGSAIMLSGGVFVAGAAGGGDREASLRAIDLAFVGVGAFFALLALFMWAARGWVGAAAPVQQGAAAPWSAFGSGWAMFGALAIFLYVGAEVAIGSLMTSFLHQESVLGLSLEQAGKLVSIYWLGAMVGRFVGAGLLTRAPAAPLLAICAAVALIMCAVVAAAAGPLSGYCALAIGFFNSIMFPSIFTLTLERSSAPPAATSGLLCMAIIGGAVLPYVAGLVADASGQLQPAFYVPLLGYAGVCAFALCAARAKVRAP